MSSTNLARDCFNFSSLDPVSIERALLAHVNRFEAQNRQVSWQDAPATFAAVSGDDDDKETIRQYRAAMEDLLDSGAIRVDRLDDGGNRLVAVAIGH
jgi:hypothetical protein